MTSNETSMKQAVEEAYVDCPRCEGSGAESLGAFSWKDCPRCHGHGFIHRDNLDGEADDGRVLSEEEIKEGL